MYKTQIISSNGGESGYPLNDSCYCIQNSN